MKQTIIAVTAAAMFLFVWTLSSRLSSDAIGMAVGLVFGVLSMLPTWLIVQASAPSGRVNANLWRSDGQEIDSDSHRQWRLRDAPSVRVERPTHRLIESRASAIIYGTEDDTYSVDYIDYRAEREQAAAQRRLLEAGWAKQLELEKATYALYDADPEEWEEMEDD